ncbi:MAG: hypothetical protein ABFS56_24650 [Pseudomonadota bacterium]
MKHHKNGVGSGYRHTKQDLPERLKKSDFFSTPVRDGICKPVRQRKYLVTHLTLPISLIEFYLQARV